MYRHGSSYDNADKWVTYNYPGFDNKSDFPTGASYLKIEFGPNNKDFWSPTIKKVEIY